MVALVWPIVGFGNYSKGSFNYDSIMTVVGYLFMYSCRRLGDREPLIMCGIFGWIKYNGRFEEEDINLSRKAVASLAHRGPNHQGEFVTENVYMGHRRLKIIDLNDNANQPFMDREKKYAIVFNGEIYNYREIREELKSAGFIFSTNSDTEVLLYAFKLWKVAAFLKFDGMYACAIHDIDAKSHYIFRDPLGQKPLYYYSYEDGLVYASELRALLCMASFSWTLHKENYIKFLSNSYYMGDMTPLCGVKKLLPGQYLKVANCNVKLKTFWDSLPGDNPLDITFEEAGLEFQRLFDRSCEISMRSDVPYGVFLSGGVDSSLVLDSCRKFNTDISAYSVAMGEKDFDESGKVKLISSKLGFDSYTTYLMDDKSIIDSLNSFLSFSDEPHGDPGFVNSYFLAKSCRTEITVGIAGDGADELFAGYVPFLALGKEKWLKHFSGPMIESISALAKQLIPGSDDYLGLQFKALAFLQGFPSHFSARFPLWLGAVSPEELEKLCPWAPSSFFLRTAEEGTIFEEAGRTLSVMEGRSRTQMFLYYYQKFFLPEYVCMHTDRSAMQNSLEVRSPFLSLPLIEFANRLPDNFKMHNKELKRILRYALLRRGFPEAIYKQKKQGFTFPIARWLKTTLRGSMEGLLSDEKWSDGLIDRTYLRRLKKEHLEGKRNNYRILFNLMVFRSWLEHFPQVRVDI